MVLVDYPEQASSPYTVTNTARWLNEKNIQHFLGREPATLPTTEASLPHVEDGVSGITASTLVLLMATVLAVAL